MDFYWFVFAYETDIDKAPAWTVFPNRKILIVIDPRVSDPERSRHEVRARGLGCTRVPRYLFRCSDTSDHTQAHRPAMKPLLVQIDNEPSVQLQLSP